MPKIFSRFDRPETIPEPPCPRDEQRFLEKIDKNGHSYLVEADIYPFYENIQKYKDDCDIYKILQRYENGDPEAIERLARKGGQYGDFTDLPTDIIDLKNKLNSAEKLFESLPKDERQACDNNVNVFLANLVKGQLPNSLKNVLGVQSEPVQTISQTIEQKVETASATAPTTINEAINGQGGNL